MRMSTLAAIAACLLIAADEPRPQQQAPPEPPTAQLEKFAPFLGSYDVEGPFNGRQWTGTGDVRPAVNGWYVEWVYRVRSGPGTDRELRQLLTWDGRKSRYRIWRFETLPVADANEGEARFEGDELIMEWTFTGPGGRPVTLRNRNRMVGKDRLLVISERRVGAGGEFEKVGETTGKRRP